MGNKSKMKEGQVELSICFGDGFTDLHLKKAATGIYYSEHLYSSTILSLSFPFDSNVVPW